MTSRQAVSPIRVVRRRWAHGVVGSLGHDLVGVEVLEPLELDQRLQARGDPAVRRRARYLTTGWIRRA